MPDLTDRSDRQPAPPTLNRLLSALPAREYQRLRLKLVEVPLIYTDVIYEPGDTIHHIYFPNSGIVSLLTAVTKDATLEVGIVGSEGAVGLPVFLGVRTSLNQAVVQGAGAAMRIKTADFLKECQKRGALASLLQRYTHTLFTQISQAAACCRFHNINARLARWLLMTGDRMQTSEFQITHEFMSNMLGARREIVTRAAAGLQRQSLISYKRGKVSILDRAALEAASCACYQIIKAEAEITL